MRSNTLTSDCLIACIASLSVHELRALHCALRAQHVLLVAFGVVDLDVEGLLRAWSSRRASRRSPMRRCLQTVKRARRSQMSSARERRDTLYERFMSIWTQYT